MKIYFPYIKLINARQIYYDFQVTEQSHVYFEMHVLSSNNEVSFHADERGRVVALLKLYVDLPEKTAAGCKTAHFSRPVLNFHFN